jgi:transcriptional regulator with XRE-family HTH domain
MLLKDNLKIYRKKINLTQKELARKMKLKQYTISDYETGRIEPNIPILIRYADVFHISLDELLSHKTKRKDTDSIESTLQQLNDLFNSLNEEKKKRLMDSINLLIKQYN